MPVTLNSSQIQQNFGDVLDQTLRGEDVIVARYGTPRAALIEYERYRKLVAAQQTLDAAAETPSSPASLKERAALYQIVSTQAAGRGLPGQSGVEAPHITVTPGVCGGRPAVRGTRIPVKAIAGYHKLGLRMDEILEGLPTLTPAQVYAALSYYYDHQDEIERQIQQDRQEQLMARYGLQAAADGRITVGG